MPAISQQSDGLKNPSTNFGWPICWILSRSAPDWRGLRISTSPAGMRRPSSCVEKLENCLRTSPNLSPPRPLSMRTPAGSEKQRGLQDRRRAMATTLSTSPRQPRPTQNRGTKKKRAYCCAISWQRRGNALSAATMSPLSTQLWGKSTGPFLGFKKGFDSELFECPMSGWIPDSTHSAAILDLRTLFAASGYRSRKLIDRRGFALESPWACCSFQRIGLGRHCPQASNGSTSVGRR